MSNTIKLIDSVIRNIKQSDKRQLFWFTDCPGFGLRVTPSGTKTFVFKYMITFNKKNRVSRWISIGKYPEWTIRRARAEYNRLYEQVYDYGRDPVKDKKDEQSKQKEKPTVKELSAIYLEFGRIKGKVSIDEEERYFKKDIYPIIGDKSVDEVSTNDIEEIQFNIIERAKSNDIATQNGKVAVKHAVACTRRLFKLAIKKELITKNPVDDIEPLGITGRRSRVLSFDEIWLFWNRIETLVPPVTAMALKFEFVTMQRGKEVRKMKFSTHKQNENVWHMMKEDTKNKKMHRVPLNRYAQDIIDDVSLYTGASPYVFGATKVLSPPITLRDNLKHLGKSALSQAINRKRDELGIEDFSPHDLRRTGATWIVAVGLPKLYARLMLNHSDGDNDVTGEVYVQYSYDFEKQRAVKVWEFILDQIVTCQSIKEIPTLDELRERVKNTGLL